MSNEPTDQERELFIATDIGSIPIMELKPMCSSFFEWLIAIVIFKIFRGKSPIIFASETRRMVRIESEQVPKRIMNYFDTLKPQLNDLGFQLNYYATVPAIGPIAIALMTMSDPRSGKAHFFAVRAVVKSNGEITEDGHIGFGSWLPNDGSMTTISPAKLPKARKGLLRKMMSTEDPKALLSEHRKRMRDNPVIDVPADGLIEASRKENLLECEDLIKRGVIRPATQGEVYKIRASR